MDVRFTNSRSHVLNAKRDQTEWSSLSTAERIGHIELEGYVLIPDLLGEPLLENIWAELASLPTEAVDYSEHQRGHRNLHWTDSPNAISVIALPEMVEFLKALFGDELICASCSYSLSQPGHPGIAIHTDSQPYGSQIFGMQASSPCLVRVLYYLDDLTPLRSPLKVIPRSHLSMHSDGIPYKRYLAHDDELMVTCKAGSAAIINQKIFHGNYPNYSDADRRMLAIAYRPRWAGPILEVQEWDSDKICRLPTSVQPYFKSLNTRDIDFDVPNRPDNLATKAPGLSPRRWER